jgi:hypothetical protein
MALTDGICPNLAQVTGGCHRLDDADGTSSLELGTKHMWTMTEMVRIRATGEGGGRRGAREGQVESGWRIWEKKTKFLVTRKCNPSHR